MAPPSPKMITNGLLVLLVSSWMTEATPPGIAKEPKRVKCVNTKFKYCNNLQHVCPKFCPHDCHVDCRSCKPICGPDSTSPPTYPHSPPPPPPRYPTSSPPKSPPPPPYPTPSPPHSPPPPSPSPPNPPPPQSPPPPTPTPPSAAPFPSSPQSPPTKPPTTSTPPPPSLPPQTPPSQPPSSPSPPTISPPPPSTSGQKRVRCKNKKYAQCYAQVHVCPANCPTTCEVDCATCKPVCSCDYPGAVCQDPRFIGGDGITFYFHGKKNKDFCIVSDPNLHINAHFIGKRDANMTRDFTWVQSLGILFDDHKLFVGARKTATWDDNVDRLALVLDGEPIFISETVGSMWRSTSKPHVSITRIENTNNIILEVERNFKITVKVVPITEKESMVHNYGITPEDCFAHLDLGFKFYSFSRKVHGVLGRTYRDDYVSNAKMGIAMPVLGGEAEFVTTSLFKPDCSIAQFRGEFVGEENPMGDHLSLSCASEMDGNGFVCKR